LGRMYASYRSARWETYGGSRVEDGGGAILVVCCVSSLASFLFPFLLCVIPHGQTRLTPGFG
jgi:hypothetical protein